MQFISSIGLSISFFFTVDIKSFCCVTDFDFFLWICQSFILCIGTLDCRKGHTYYTNPPSPSLYSQLLAASTGILAFIVFLVTLLAPQVGAFETDLTVNGLKQAATNINQTKVMTERAEADSLGELLMALC